MKVSEKHFKASIIKEFQQVTKNSRDKWKKRKHQQINRNYFKRDWIEIKKLKNILTETENSLGKLNGRVELKEDRIKKFEYGTMEFIQSEQQREKRNTHRSTTTTTLKNEQSLRKLEQ